ncbi:hypothetical protein PISMIDRAFT_114952, partial [Pisolithus microcarpus 441]
LSGISAHLFWRDWPLAEPSTFLTPKSLHEWHHQFWDHDIHWCKHALGATELDFQFSIIPHITGIAHFPNGITKLKQVGISNDILLLYIIAGAADPGVVIAICTLMEFQYYSQAITITLITHDRIQASLQDFHNHQDAVIQNGHCCGERMKQALRHWHIPKLKLMQSVAPSIKQVGSILQWSADTTEHAYIEVIKDPASTTNNHSYNTQICWSLNRSEKCQLFDTALALCGSTSEPTSMLQLGQETNDSDSESSERDKDRSMLDGIWTSKRKTIDFFDVAAQLLVSPPDSVPHPPHTFIARSTTIHLNYNPVEACTY